MARSDATTVEENLEELPLLYAALANQKRYMVIYLMGVYGDQETERWFRDRYAETGKRMDVGKSCVRFRKLDDLPLGLVGQAIADVTPASYITRYEAAKRR
jgi:hypothetical protein